VLPLFVSIPPKPLELLKTLLTRPSTATAIIHFGAKGIGPATAAFKRGDRELGLRLFGNAVLGQDAFASLSAERLEQVRANLIDAEFLGSGFAPLPVEAVAQIQRPTLLLGSENSPRLLRLLLNRLQEVLPHVEREEIPSASHIMHEDNPDAFFEAVFGFLKSQRGAA
jgi:pimeloyl-ACP methyl ester carboxylesterase